MASSGLNLKNKYSPALLDWLSKVRFALIGREADKGFLFKAFIYLILIDTTYIYLKPILSMLTTMVKNAQDMTDPAVNWIPKVIYLGNLQEAWTWLNYPTALGYSIFLSLTVAVLQTFSCAIAGYAFARLRVPFKGLMFLLLIITFVVPIQVTILPNLVMARELGLFNTLYPIIVPAAFGLGLKGALFVIIYRQFFATQPKELEEAAKIDGASVFKVYFKVMLPLAKPAIVVVFLFSFIWTWNDWYLPAMFLPDAATPPLSRGISKIASALSQMEAASGPSPYAEQLRMATTFLMIIPPIILYLFTQRQFIEGVERTGLVE